MLVNIFVCLYVNPEFKFRTSCPDFLFVQSLRHKTRHARSKLFYVFSLKSKLCKDIT